MNLLIIGRVRYRIKSLLRRGIFEEYSLNETQSFLKENLENYESLRETQLKIQYISTLEKAEDFFVHKLSFEKVCSQQKVELNCMGPEI